MVRWLKFCTCHLFPPFLSTWEITKIASCAQYGTVRHQVRCYTRSPHLCNPCFSTTSIPILRTCINKHVESRMSFARRYDVHHCLKRCLCLGQLACRDVRLNDMGKAINSGLGVRVKLSMQPMLRPIWLSRCRAHDDDGLTATLFRLDTERLHALQQGLGTHGVMHAAASV